MSSDSGTPAAAVRDIPVLEIGGTHVSSALVRAGVWAVSHERRIPLDSSADADHILDTFVAAGADLAPPSHAVWGVAMPDPFDYVNGIATFRDVGKFDAIYGVDIAAVLRERLPGHAASVSFLNDADAFILGEWTTGAARGFGHCVGITLGTGLGSGWLVDGRITDSAPGVPPLGRARTIVVDGAGLEDTMSRRAVRRAYARRSGDAAADVLEICLRARDGEAAATDTLREALRGLGRGMSGPLREFGTDIVVVGGSMAGSWDLFEPWFRDGLAWPDAPPVRLAADPEHAALIGAARHALRSADSDEDAWMRGGDEPAQ
ncbi:MAG TPA: ROK family protein [Jatrophihabitantaceae bacterium]|jgi:glucokinase|nr:ROK family protein [Jatrophihabitantaceae bacterium]